MFWAAQWMSFVLIYFRFSDAPDTLAVLLIDLQSLLALGFF